MATESLIVELDARTKKLEDKLSSTEKKLNTLDKKTKQTSTSFDGLSKTSVAVGKGVLAVGAAAATAAIAITALTRVVSDYSREIKVASQLSGIAVEKLQLMAFATATVGIGLEDLGDKSKDTREKIGDFLNTGGGGFMDFVDAMKLTKKEAREVAIEFSKLSGVEILQEMVRRMEDAEVSAVQMSHALEGMASDTTKLIPLLKDGGAEMQRLSDAAASISIPLSEDDIDTFIRMGTSADLAATAFKSLGEQILVDLGNAFIEAADNAAHFYATLNEGTVAQKTSRLAEIKDEIDSLKEGIENSKTAAGRLWNTLTFNTSQEKFALEKINVLLAERIQLTKDLGKSSFGIGEDGGGSDGPSSIIPNAATSADDNAKAIQAITDRFKTEEDLLKAKLEKDLEIIGENDELKELLHQEYLDNIFNMEEDAASRQKDLDEKSNEDKLKGDRSRHKSEQSLQMSNISSIMTIVSALVGHNDKIGKALFIGAQALAASQVFFNTQAAATRAIAELGVVAGTPVAAAIETSGSLRIAAIAATTLGGLSSSSGGGGGGGAVASSPEPVQENFQPETSNLELSDSSASGSQVLNITVPDGDEIGEAIANWLNKAQTEGRV